MQRLPRQIALPAGRVLEVRAASRADTEALVAMFENLDDDDRYRRFFSLYRPRREFCEGIATVADRGGFGLVAHVSGANSTELVGEAGYTLLDDETGELGITVVRGWRGWLGPLLLDTLLDCAAERGVANIQADVLLANRPMLALARARGYAAVAHDDWSVVRVLLGTKGRTPRWPSATESPRVLVEVPGARWSATEAARAAGLHVLVCPGPGSSPARCPALTGEECPLAKQADVVVVAKPEEDPQWDALLDAHAALHPGVPVVVMPRNDRSIIAMQRRIATSLGRHATAARAET